MFVGICGILANFVLIKVRQILLLLLLLLLQYDEIYRLFLEAACLTRGVDRVGFKNDDVLGCISVRGKEGKKPGTYPSSSTLETEVWSGGIAWERRESGT